MVDYFHKWEIPLPLIDLCFSSSPVGLQLLPKAYWSSGFQLDLTRTRVWHDPNYIQLCAIYIIQCTKNIKNCIQIGQRKAAHLYI